MRAQHVALMAMVFGAAGLRLPADEIRYYEQNGVTYREVRPGGPQTASRDPLATGTGETACTYWTPVTAYRWEAHWVNRWNPFAEPYVVYRAAPCVRWEQRTGVVRPLADCGRAAALTPTAVVPLDLPPPPSTLPAPSAGTLPAPSAGRKAEIGGITRFGEVSPRFGRPPAGQTSGSLDRPSARTTLW
jgi:hypothetical protein